MTDQPPTEQQLDEIETRAAAATPGPWGIYEYGTDGSVTDVTAEVRRLRAEMERRTEAVAFLERTTLPELRREIEHHKDGKQRWRARAEAAEARVAELAAVHAFLDEQERAARLFELPTPAWVEAVRAASVPPGAPLRPSQPSSVSESVQSPTGAPEGALSALLPADDFTGTQPCGHDDYHDPHPWHGRPDLWCPGIGYDDAAEEQQ